MVSIESKSVELTAELLVARKWKKEQQGIFEG